MEKRRGAAGLLLASALFTHAVEASAWGDDGHRVVGEIAWHYLSPRAAARVRACLSDEPYTTLAEAATWADTYARRDPNYAWANPLHYVNVPAGAPAYVAARDCPTGCVVTAIEHFRNALGEPGEDLVVRKRRREALYFLAHFVGDIHQPLHVAHPDNRGGNSTQVVFFGQPQRAHWVWDDGILTQALSTSSTASAVPRGWADLAFELRMELEPSTVRAWQNTTDPALWASEVLALAKQHAYLRPGQVLDAAHVKAKFPVVRRQLQKAGVRLAAILNTVFATAE